MSTQHENKEKMRIAIEAQKIEKRKNLNKMLFDKIITKEEFDRKIETCK